MWQAAIVAYSRNATDSGKLPRWGGSAIDVAAVADGNHENHQAVILNVADDAVVTGPVAPEVIEAYALHRGAM
ncbi:MAG: hypothetical protein JWQ89_887 [Devosia sp.]|nr:hypothetical protein [Devosia sp.]